MPNKKKTGLGDSLLLKRTEPESTPEPNAADVQTPERSEGATTSKPSRKKKPPRLRDRCTIYLDRDVNENLHLAARIEGRERSEIVSEILRQNLPKYRVEREE